MAGENDQPVHLFDADQVAAMRKHLSVTTTVLQTRAQQEADQLFGSNVPPAVPGCDGDVRIYDGTHAPTSLYAGLKGE